MGSSSIPLRVCCQVSAVRRGARPARSVCHVRRGPVPPARRRPGHERAEWPASASPDWPGSAHRAAVSLTVPFHRPSTGPLIFPFPFPFLSLFTSFSTAFHRPPPRRRGKPANSGTSDAGHHTGRRRRRGGGPRAHRRSPCLQLLPHCPLRGVVRPFRAGHRGSAADERPAGAVGVAERGGRPARGVPAGEPRRAAGGPPSGGRRARPARRDPARCPARRYRRRGPAAPRPRCAARWAPSPSGAVRWCAVRCGLTRAEGPGTGADEGPDRFGLPHSAQAWPLLRAAQELFTADRGPRTAGPRVRVRFLTTRGHEAAWHREPPRGRCRAAART